MTPRVAFLLLATAACSGKTGERKPASKSQPPEPAQPAAESAAPAARAGFQPPDARARARAVGTTMNLEDGLQAAFDPAPFTPIAAPLAGDWLTEHREAGQSFDQYLRGRPNRPSAMPASGLVATSFASVGCAVVSPARPSASMTAG